MATLLFFGPLVDITGCRRDDMTGRTLDDFVEQARQRYGDSFSLALSSCAIWVNGEAIARDAPVPEQAEIAFLPPVSGG